MATEGSSGRTVEQSVPRRLWARWKMVAEKIGVFQSRVLLVVLYFVLVTPFALVVRLAKDPLRLRRREGSYWIPRRGAAPDIEWAKRQ